MFKFLQLTSVACTVLTSYDGGPTYNVDVDSVANTLKITVNGVPENSYFAIAFGPGMSNTDMVMFQGAGNGDVTDLWSTSYGMPSTDTTQDYTVNKNEKVGSAYNFVVERALDTSDSQDKALACGNNYQMAWVAHDSSSYLTKHNKKGKFSLDISADCSAKTEAGAFHLMAGMVMALATIYI